MIDSTLTHHLDEEYYNKLIGSGVTLNNIEIGGSNFRETINYLVSNVEALKKIGMDKIIIAKRSDDIIKAKKEGKIAIFWGSQVGRSIESDERLLETLYMMGLRVFGLCYNIRNYIADGLNEITDAGLSAFGHKVVEKCNELGIVIDLSHVGHQSSLDAIEASNQPVIFSHSNAMSVYRNLRNIYDDQVKAISEKNGVIGVTGFGLTIKQLRSNEDKPHLDDMLNHLDYYANMIGTEHIGIGLDVGYKRTKEEVDEQIYHRFDFNAAEWLPKSGAYFYSHNNWYVEELRDPSGWPKITEGLVARGYSDNEILKILGGNFLRIFKEVWDK
jgi:membrane dipeptidase